MADAQDNDTKRAKPSLLRRLVKGVVTLSITGAVLAGSAYAVAIGSEELAARAAAVPEPEAAPLIPVTAVPMVAEEGYTVTRRFIGQVEPQKTVDVSFELSGRLEDILVDEGDTVTAGQVLARQDTSLLQSERTRLNAPRLRRSFALPIRPSSATKLSPGEASQRRNGWIRRCPNVMNSQPASPRSTPTCSTSTSAPTNPKSVPALMAASRHGWSMAAKLWRPANAFSALSKPQHRRSGSASRSTLTQQTSNRPRLRSAAAPMTRRWSPCALTLTR